MKIFDKKNKEQLLSEIEGLNKTVQLLKKSLHDKFFSSLKDMNMEDYDLITEQETDAIFKGNKKGDFILVNGFASKLTGYSENELLNMNISKLFKTDVLDQKPLRFDLVQAGKSIKNQRTIRKKDGSFVMIEMTSKKLSDESLICIMKDISKETELQTALKQSEDKFQEIFDSAADIMILAKFRAGNIPLITEINKATLNAFGYTKKELIGQNATILIKSKITNLHIKYLTKVLLGKRVIFESVFIKKNGEVFPVEISAKLIRTETEKLVHMVARDISERLTVQNQIKASEERYRLLFELLPYGGEVIDNKGFITEVSPGTATMLGYEKQELIGKHISSLIDKESVLKYKDKFPNLLKGNKEEAEICMIRKDGTKVSCIRSGQPIFNDQGKVESILTLSVDITERKKVEQILLERNKKIASQNKEYQFLNEELIIAKEKAEESNRLKSAFLANMSHEIRTPMNGIIGFSQLLTTPELSGKKIKDYTDIIIHSGKHLLSIINDIIDISKIDAGQIQIHKKTFNINHVLNELFSFFNSQKTEAFSNKAKLITVLPLDDNEVNINTDETRFKQIFSNLINNAIKFTEEGTIEFGYKPEKNKLVFYVKDTGIGINKNMQILIFERFTQATINTEKLYGGTGLGLAISKACTKLLEGDIWLESEEGKGSTFFFSLPFNKSSENIPKKTQESREFSFNNESILIVEDDPINFTYLQEIISEYCITIVHMDTAKKAIEAVKQTNFQLVLMDIQLPGEDGNYAIREIKKTNPDLPIIAQSAYAFESDKQKSFDAGCDDYIIKPIIKEELLRKIKQNIK